MVKMNKAVTEKVLEAVTDRHKGLSDAILCITIFDVRRIIEDAIDETKREIAKRVVEERQGMVELLVEQGFLDVDDNIEELVSIALERL